MHVPTLSDWCGSLLLLPTSTIWFSLDHTRNVSDWVISGIRMLSSTLLIMTLTPSLVKTSLKGLFAWRDWEEGPSTRKILECESFSGHMFSVFSLHLSLVLGSSKLNSRKILASRKLPLLGRSWYLQVISLQSRSTEKWSRFAAKSFLGKLFCCIMFRWPCN